MISLKIGKQKFNCPNGWHEVTQRQWLKIKECKTANEIVSILTEVTEISDDLLLQLTPFLNWMNEPFSPKEWEKPSEVNMFCQTIKTDIDITRKSLAQKIMLQNLIAGAKDLDKIMGETIAIYVQPVIQNVPFDYGKAKDLAAGVEDMPLCIVQPFAGFFLNSCKR